MPYKAPHLNIIKECYLNCKYIFTIETKIKTTMNSMHVKHWDEKQKPFTILKQQKTGSNV